MASDDTYLHDFTVRAVDGHVVHGSHWPTENARAVVLLLHGITGTRHENGYFDRVAAALQERSVATFAVDYRGHGDSAVPLSELMLSGVMLDIDATWAHVMNEYRSVPCRIISGTSFGGGAAFLYGQRNPAVDATLLTMPVMSYVDDLARVNPDWRIDVERGFVGYETRKLSPLLLPELHFFDGLIEATEVSKPVVILHGKADSDVPFGASVEFAKRSELIDVVGLDDMDHGWAAPGDLGRTTQASWDNQVTAADATVEIIEHLVASTDAR